MEDNKAEYESKLEEYTQLLDIRAARIRVSSTDIEKSYIDEIILQLLFDYCNL